MTRRQLNPTTDFAALFPAVTASSWRWECQGHYAVDQDELDQWLAGTPKAEDDSDRAWYAYIRSLAGRAIPFQRVRMLTDPLTDYLRWMLATTHRNIAAGEDIRWITQGEASELGMPDYDFYVFDDDRIAILHFDNAKILTGATIDDAPHVVDQHRRWRDLVWQHAVRHEDYTAAH